MQTIMRLEMAFQMAALFEFFTTTIKMASVSTQTISTEILQYFNQHCAKSQLQFIRHLFRITKSRMFRLCKNVHYVYTQDFKRYTLSYTA
jgi:hypothetical protein